MFTGDTHTADTHTLSSTHVIPSWNLPASASARMPIEALREEDEDDNSHHHTPDLEQTLSAALRSSAAREHTPQPLTDSPASCSNVSNVSASPAAAFLSFFCSPTPQQTANPDDEGQVVTGYTLGPIIGYGATSIIRTATSSSGTQTAVKIVRRSDLVKAGNAPQARRKLEHEAAVWGTLSHEHVLPLFSVVHHPYADYFFTLYCPAGSLLDILNRDGSPALPQDDAGMMLRQVVRGLRYLHDTAGYVHRDLKLENVLVDEMGVCKIGDFGMSRRIDSDDDTDDDQEDYLHLPSFGGGMANVNNSTGVHRAVSLAAPSKRIPRSPLNHPHHAMGMMRHNSARHRNSTSTNEPVHTFQPGSLPYASPELLLPQTSEGRRPHPSQDIWALGVMLYALLTGRLPFTDSFEPRLQMKILNGYYTVPPGIGKGAERILAGCLKSSVQERWTISMVDEVSWGVGWGAEGDDAAAHDSDDHNDECLPPLASASSRSRSHSRPPTSARSTRSDWQLDEPRSRASQEAASRRSTSRAKRSLSRVPLMPLSAGGSGRRSDSYDYDRYGSRSASRHPPRSRSPVSASVSFSTPPLPASTSGSSGSGSVSASAALTTFSRSQLQHQHPPPPIPLKTPSTSTSTASLSYLGSAYQEDDHESALDMSPSPPLLSAPAPRGRRPSKHQQYHQHSASRSPSPSVVPTTPRDAPLGLASPAHVDATPLEDLEHLDLGADSTRAATAKSRGRQASRSQGQVVGQLSLAMAAAEAEAEAMARSDSFASASTSDSVGTPESGRSGSSTSRMDRIVEDGDGDGAEKPSSQLRRRAASSQPPRRNQRPTSSPPTAGPRMLNLNLNMAAPPAPLDPFLTPASVTATAPTLLVNRSRSAHPRG
ncbi:hypothetical protein D9619_007040 [Psilocybe cf. subviscida]|uniref:Protein kinase domain-containing protein n=1 Tax=Psilocybe cf. subviscida TaxID=2480587 RepID=A0A8H5B3T9_9AGAR|nr:hypothetical protein D9619_007040 [Psilocybe cf. subviscida]